MFLNLVTTNSSEALELLDNLIPAIVIVVLLYIPALAVATVSVIKKRELPELFIHRERKRARLAMIAGVLSLGAAYLFDSRYELKSDLYPANVCYNIALAFQRTAQTQSYAKTSKDFTFIPKRIGKSMLWLLGKRPVRLIGRFMVIIAKRTPNCQR